MEQDSNIVAMLLSKQTQLTIQEMDKKYEKLGLKFNPFPKSGTTNINSSDFINGHLVPIDDSVKANVFDFISHALQENPVDPMDKFLTATVTGDYGSGKTQLLMYVKYLLGLVASNKDFHKNPYVIYIDNPGIKLSELIGSIISKIGEENFKKFIWNKIIERISKNESYRKRLVRFEGKGSVLFDQNPNPYADENLVSYKKFLDAFIKYIPTIKQKKEFDSSFRDLITEVLEIELGDSVLTQYFYDLISEDFGVNKTWEALSSGAIRQLDKKEAGIIRYIVRLIKEQGFTDFFILVDEFEDITEGRLSKIQVDNYIYNLRTLLDEQREWCLMFAMTGQALKKLKSVSPPLADRISARLITLQSIDQSQAEKIIINYLNIARDKKLDVLVPFEKEGIRYLVSETDGNSRAFLRGAYYLIEKAAKLFQEGNLIDETFIKSNASQER